MKSLLTQPKTHIISTTHASLSCWRRATTTVLLANRCLLMQSEMLETFVLLGSLPDVLHVLHEIDVGAPVRRGQRPAVLWGETGKRFFFLLAPVT
jgi:hypothetical protein